MTSIGFLSTFPPTRCGLATFTASLSDAVADAADVTPSVVRILTPDESAAAAAERDDRVAGHLVNGDPQSIREAAAMLNRSGAAVIQHEYGIFGGQDGAEVISLLEQLTVPAIIVLHTVLPNPSPHQRAVLQSVCSHASFVIVMTQHARETLLSTVTLDARRIRVIPHGARTPIPSVRTAPEGARPRLLTWGLISPGKGLEWSIRSVAELAASGTLVDYVIAGQTHPKLVAEQGEAYRDSLIALVGDLGLSDQVHFVDHYLSPAALDELIGDADVVVLPYESSDQATSGVLAEAVAARIPVVSTGFPHAIELLSDGAGLVVPHRDPVAMAAAVSALLRGETRGTAGGTAAAELTSWSTVGRSYVRLLGSLLAERAA
ncbi:glycosyltransferase [uncultured Microbacterium sp.]|uniref:glycosyltransferase n=1 Tax=uncultured Microbacterium sp. TaxID=191216 RepID=UPI0028D6CF3E|nr:glycosyltransferase [uncultured Microbacterium sp.]